MTADPATSRARAAIAEALFTDTYGGSSGLDDMLAAICEQQADVALSAIAAADLEIIDTRTHVAVLRVPSEENSA
jgi:hypothetical protein